MRRSLVHWPNTDSTFPLFHLKPPNTNAGLLRKRILGQKHTVTLDFRPDRHLNGHQRSNQKGQRGQPPRAIRSKSASPSTQNRQPCTSLAHMPRLCRRWEPRELRFWFACCSPTWPYNHWVAFTPSPMWGHCGPGSSSTNNIQQPRGACTVQARGATRDENDVLLPSKKRVGTRRNIMYFCVGTICPV